MADLTFLSSAVQRATVILSSNWESLKTGRVWPGRECTTLVTKEHPEEPGIKTLLHPLTTERKDQTKWPAGRTELERWLALKGQHFKTKSHRGTKTMR